jgi:hypothetical protein
MLGFGFFGRRARAQEERGDQNDEQRKDVKLAAALSILHCSLRERDCVRLPACDVRARSGRFNGCLSATGKVAGEATLSELVKCQKPSFAGTGESERKKGEWHDFQECCRRTVLPAMYKKLVLRVRDLGNGDTMNYSLEISRTKLFVVRAGK